MTRVVVVLLASLFAGCASVGSREVVTLPVLFVCEREVYWFDHPPVKTFRAPRFSPPKNVLYSPRPDYTYEARLKRWEDTMLVELHVTAGGTVDLVKIVEHPRHSLFELVAKAGFRQWRFTPGAPDRVRIPVTFSLRCAEKNA